MSRFDDLIEKCTRTVAQRTSRRSVLAGISGFLFGAAMIPVLPVARAAGGSEGGYPGVGAQESGIDGDPGDPTSCDYWRYCALGGTLCACCGGTLTSCPPGSELSPITWVGTCHNPADDRDYLISYNDCCGKRTCQRCGCHSTEREKPVYFPSKASNVLWCFGTEAHTYHCTVAGILGEAADLGD